jgi:hypothetical protein
MSVANQLFQQIGTMVQSAIEAQQAGNMAEAAARYEGAVRFIDAALQHRSAELGTAPKQRLVQYRGELLGHATAINASMAVTQRPSGSGAGLRGWPLSSPSTAIPQRTSRSTPDSIRGCSRRWTWRWAASQCWHRLPQRLQAMALQNANRSSRTRPESSSIAAKRRLLHHRVRSLP